MTDPTSPPTASGRDERCAFEALDEAPVSIMLVDVDSLILFANQTAHEEFAAASSTDLQGGTLSQLVVAAERKRFLAWLDAIISNSIRSSGFSLSLLTTPGKALHTELAARRMIWQDRPCAMIIFQDIGRQRLYEDLLSYREELQMQNEELQKTQDELEQSRSLFSNLFEFAPVGYITLDRKGLIQRANLTLATMLGTDRMELLNRQLMLRIVAEDRGVFRAFFHKFIEEKQENSCCEVRMELADGPPLWVQLEATPSQWQNEDEHYLLAVMDISDLKASQHEMQKSQALYRLLADNVTDVIWTIDQDLKTTYISPSVEKLRGFKPEELIGQPVLKYTAPESARKVQEIVTRNMSRYLRGEEVVKKFEVEQYHKDGHTIWVEVNSTATYDEQGRFTGFIGITRDITKNHEDREKLLRSEQQKALILDSTSDRYSLLDLDQNIRWTNRAVLEASGRGENDVIGRPCHHVWQNTEEICRNCPIRRCLKTGEIEQDEISTLDGQHWILRGYPVRDSDGEMVGVIEFGQNITDHKAKEQLEAANKLAVAIAHEFRNPMAVIKMGLEMAEQQEMDMESRSRLLEQVNAQFKRMDTLIQNLLDLKEAKELTYAGEKKYFDLHSK